jgi:uncharacterized membrane protein
MSPRDPATPGPFDGAVRRDAGPPAPEAPPADSGWGADDPQDWDPELDDDRVVTPPRQVAREPHAHGRGGHRFAYAIIGLLVAASLVCVVLIAARSWYSHTYHYWFLLWNLALAWVPFVFAGVAYALAPARRRAYLWVLVVLAAVVWLAFFPNAPYILTDFLHLGSMGDIVPGWYDVLMLYWFAWTGLILGIVSLYLMHEIVARGLGTVTGWVFVVVVAGVGSLGIYLGRFLRWNSWDLVRRPGPLADELLGRVTDPHSQPRLLGFTVLFALLFLFIYVAVYIFAKLTKPPEAREKA